MSVTGAKGCAGCDVRVPAPADRVEVALPGLAGVSDLGLRHRHNEDALALGRRPDGLRAGVVCDGVSSSREPERAAHAAAGAALAGLLADPAPDDLEAVDPDPSGAGTRRTAAAVAAAAAAVTALGTGRDAPACTIVTALLDVGGPVTVGWVGDSRAYWLPARGEPWLLTADHSWAAAAVAAGLLDADSAARDRRAHVITGWLGPQGRRAPDVVTLDPDGPGLLLLCSDGLWNDHAEPAELAALVPPHRAGPDELAASAAALAAAALDAGGHDNITVVLLRVDGR